MPQLRNLLAATEAVGDNNRHRSCCLHRGKQTILCNGLRHLKFVGFKAKRASHSAASGLDQFDSCASLAKQCDLLARTAEYRFMVAVAVQQNLCACKAADGKIRRFGGQPVGKQPDLAAKTPRTGVLREKFK